MVRMQDPSHLAAKDLSNRALGDRLQSSVGQGLQAAAGADQTKDSLSALKPTAGQSVDDPCIHVL